MDVRAVALDLLMEYENCNKFVNLSLSSHKADSLTQSERSFLTALLYTSVEQKLRYDYYIGAISERSVSDIDMRVRCILRLGICQILDMKIADYAAVNETVKLCRNRSQTSFVNGVLRAVARIKDNMPEPAREKNIARYLSVKYSFPLAIVKHFIKLVGERSAEQLLDFYNKRHGITLSVNTARTTRAKLLQRISEEGVVARESELSDVSIVIDSSQNPEKLYGYNEGLFFVQDTASAISGAVVCDGAGKGERIIDVCACPGGKSFGAAIRMPDCEVLSFDLHASKLSLVSEGAARLGLDNIRVGVCDATLPSAELIGSADRVICDVPCSGLGVLSKKPDIRYRDMSSVDKLPQLQYEILSASAAYLRRGGVMVYSTCTLNPSENEEVVARFLDTHAGFVREDFTVSGLRSNQGELTLYPHLHNTDGFFIAKLRKL